MSATSPAPRTAPRRNSPADTQELQDFCARPACRAAFIKTIGPGRPQNYCSEICRRSAERELRQARARLAHFEAVVDQLRVDVAAFDQPIGDTEDGQAAQRRQAEDALTRAGGILNFIGHSPDPLAQELRTLHDAVAPLLQPQ